MYFLTLLKSCARSLAGVTVCAALLLPPGGLTLAAFNPAQNLDPSGSGIRLDSSFQSDAWLVYTYDIDVDGSVADARIRSSNGVPEVDQAVLQQLNSMKFRPATRDGKPVRVAADPVIYTWILDKPREMSPRFTSMYRQAWDLYAQGNYAAASDIAGQLQGYPGRNALEEVKSRILSASLANRGGEEGVELRHLGRVVELQNLALNNGFRNTYVGDEQFLKILNRIQVLQLNRMMLADAGDTLEQIRKLAGATPLSIEARERQAAAQQAFELRPDVTIEGELSPLYSGGAGAWKVGLSRESFSVSDVKGSIGAIFLVCAQGEIQLRYPSVDNWKIPAGWSQCKIDVSGKDGTRLVLHQHAPG